MVETDSEFSANRSSGQVRLPRGMSTPSDTDREFSANRSSGPFRRLCGRSTPESETDKEFSAKKSSAPVAAAGSGARSGASSGASGSPGALSSRGTGSSGAISSAFALELFFFFFFLDSPSNNDNSEASAASRTSSRKASGSCRRSSKVRREPRKTRDQLSELRRHLKHKITLSRRRSERKPKVSRKTKASSICRFPKIGASRHPLVMQSTNPRRSKAKTLRRSLAQASSSARRSGICVKLSKSL
mmetsp:Transcript_38388/g.82836  ORF Transcript_38388/g.82836 Transcript_38388/m.82836 type:complete len:245 (+) Transcript_38388:773-1507(+)